MLVIGDNFSYGGSKPLDARLTYNTLAQMKAVADATMYDGCTAYCKEADKTYQWKSTNTVDADTGKWREYPSGGGGGGHTIEDSEGTALTQRDTLQFGEGFLAEDDDTNEKTVISPDVMQSEDMSDVITPLPSVGNKMPVLFDESGAERVVGWYKYANGTKKPVYEKYGTCSITGGSRHWNTLASISNVDKALDCFVNVNGYILGGYWGSSSSDYIGLVWSVDDTIGNLKAVTNGLDNWNGFYIVRYTKSTDIAE